jgi:hypothetical protein
MTSRFTSQKPGQDTRAGVSRKSVRYINDVTKLCAIRHDSIHLNLSEISESLRKFGVMLHFVTCEHRCSCDLRRNKLFCRSLSQARPSLHRIYIRLAAESARSQPARGHSGRPAVWPAPWSRRTSLSGPVPLFSSKRPPANVRFGPPPIGAPSIPRKDCRRIDGSPIQTARYRRYRDPPRQILDRGRAPHSAGCH